MGQEGAPQFFSLGPFDSARFAALTEGLEVSVVALSEVRASEKVRIDSAYFSRAAVELAARVASMPNAKLGDMTSTLRKGIFDIKADTYVETGGVPFVRVGDLRTGLIDAGSLARISAEAHALENKTALVRDDLILSKTAYPAAALVTVPECNVSQDTVAVSLSASGRQRFRPGYVVAYLNSVAGRALMGRLFQGNVQEHLGLSEAAELLIPELDLGLQQRVERLIYDAESAREEATAALAQAESDLLDALGLRNWSPPEPLTYTRSAADVFAAGRLDAQYFQPAKLAMIERLARLPGGMIDDRFVIGKERVDPRSAPTAPCRNYDLTDALQPVLDDSTEPGVFADMESQKVVFADGDLAVARLRSYLREIAVVDVRDDIPSVGSTEFFPLRKRPGADAPSAETMMIYLRSPPVQVILKWCQDGSQHPRFSERDLLAIPLPDVVRDQDQAIRHVVREALAARRRSLDLLAAAKRAVEIAIEQGEAEGFAFARAAAR